MKNIKLHKVPIIDIIVKELDDTYKPILDQETKKIEK